MSMNTVISLFVIRLLFQVINVNDYQVILSSDTLPVVWQDKRTRTNAPKLTSLPPIKPKIGPGQMTFTSLGNVNILGQNPNQFSTIVIKDGKITDTNNIVAGNNVIHQNSSTKRLLSKASKTFKVRKKPIQTKKIMLKPASSLLTQTALDCRNENSTKNQVDISHTVSLSLEMKSSNSAIDSIIQTISEPVTLPLTVSTSNLILTQGNFHSLNSSNSSNSDARNSSNTTSDLSEPCSYSENAGHGKHKKEIAHNTTNIKLVDCLATSNTIEIYSEPCVNEQAVILNSNECTEDQKNEVNIDQGDHSSKCRSQIHQNNDSIENTSNMQNLIDLTREEDFHSDHMETIILPSDMEHHEGIKRYSIFIFHFIADTLKFY